MDRRSIVPEVLLEILSIPVREIREGLECRTMKKGVRECVVAKPCSIQEAQQSVGRWKVDGLGSAPMSVRIAIAGT